MPDRIVVRGAREHNLRNIDVEIPRDKLVVVTGLSGSGKSSLAFDTLYSEGQRRYVESLSAYARQFLEQMEKPDVDQIEGLSPAIAIEQKAASRNPRSTVATVTEIHDYLRLLYARCGRAHCPQCDRPIASQTVEQVVDRLLALPEKTRINLYAPVVRSRKGEHRRELQELRRAGFVRVRVDGEIRELADDIGLAKTVAHTIEVLVDRLTIRAGLEKRLADSLETAFARGDEVARVERLGGDGSVLEELLFSRRFACVDCGVSLPELSPRMFSFNSPQGACPACNGLGVNRYFDPDLLVPDVRKSLAAGAVAVADRKTAAQLGSVFAALARQYGFRLSTPWGELSAAARQVVLEGTRGAEVEIELRKDGKRRTFARAWEGLAAFFQHRYETTESPWLRDELESLMSARPCATCGGARLRRESLAVRVGGMTIAELARLSVGAACAFFDTLELSAQEREIARLLLKEIRDRLGFLQQVGLDYLTLERTSATLSGGEGQRLRLATQIGSSLSGVLYILDEPSIGLHQRDNARLLATLRRLRDLGNTVLVVEHDRDTMLAADHLIDMGPGAGREGGTIVAAGPPAEVMANPRSLTGRYLAGIAAIPTPRTRRPGSGWSLVIRGAREHNLKKVTVAIPLGTITCVTGVSGSGKSSLVIDTLYRALAQKLNGSRERAGAYDEIEGWQLLDKVIDIDQAPIGRTPRSNPATYTGLFTHVREVFAQLPEARARGYDPGRFSFNVKGGRCEACKGDGVIRIEMHFLPDVFVTCDVCAGRRYARETLEVLYRGKSIADVLDLTVAEALDFLSPFQPIRTKLATLHDVGLDYVHLGQAATTLSGGEAQRIKLARELARRTTGRTLYVLDEPTTGLHFEDVRRLLAVLERLADQGNTVVVIEHNLDVIRTADRVVDLGPEGGDGGGEIVAVGTPEQVAEVARSHTGRYLRDALR
ncbi:MAG: excinuclease ABC subunit A [Polyangiaceae bacterium UTPRO1]|jgi:excinuclease ABC subunit A|nr:excinuclease ABC subunit UvrA [Myxococcales bacterium]OQY67796.1 MAG: excinuclease ABC subunit A [Polyangiaceae bacterium UTPRO1]